MVLPLLQGGSGNHWTLLPDVPQPLDRGQEVQGGAEGEFLYIQGDPSFSPPPNFPMCQNPEKITEF